MSNDYYVITTTEAGKRYYIRDDIDFNNPPEDAYDWFTKDINRAQQFSSRKMASDYWAERDLGDVVFAVDDDGRKVRYHDYVKSVSDIEYETMFPDNENESKSIKEEIGDNYSNNVEYCPSCGEYLDGSDISYESDSWVRYTCYHCGNSFDRTKYYNESKSINEDKSLEGTIKLTDDFYYDNVQNIKDADWDEVIELFEENGWVSGNNMIIPEGTRLRKVDHNLYYNFYEIVGSSNSEKIPILIEQENDIPHVAFENEDQPKPRNKKNKLKCPDCGTVSTRQECEREDEDDGPYLACPVCDTILYESKSIKEGIHRIYVDGELKDEIESSNPVHEVDSIAYKYKKLNGVKEVRVEYADGTTYTMQVESKSIKEGAFSGGYAGDNSFSGGTVRGIGASTQPDHKTYLNRIKAKNPKLVDIITIKAKDLKPNMMTQAGQIKTAEVKYSGYHSKDMVYVMHTNGWDYFKELDADIEVMADPDNKSNPFTGNYKDLLKMGLQESVTRTSKKHIKGFSFTAESLAERLTGK